MNRGSRHIAGKGIQIACRECGKDHPDGPFRTQTLMFASMEAHGWHKGPDICFKCGESWGKADAAGWLDQEPAPGPPDTRRRRKIRRLL